MASTADKLSKYLVPGETVEHAMAANWETGGRTVPALVGITRRRLVVVQRVMGFGQPQTAAVDLASVVEVQTGGGLSGTVVLRTGGGSVVSLKAVRGGDLRAIQGAVAAARG